MREHIQAANRNLYAYVDQAVLTFEMAEVWRSELEANSKVLDALPEARMPIRVPGFGRSM